MEPMDEDDFFHLKLKSYRNVRLLALRHITQSSFQQIAASFQEWVR